MVDAVAAGFDAGIEIGEVIDQDMIIIPYSGDLKLAIVGAPARREWRRGRAALRGRDARPCLTRAPS